MRPEYTIPLSIALAAMFYYSMMYPQRSVQTMLSMPRYATA